MTSAISVDKKMPYHKHIPENERLKQYLECILYYIIKSDFSDIVFVDWSGFNLSVLNFLKEVAEIYDKNIEILSFKYNTATVVEKWKWYGENTILEYWINNSALLKHFTCFYKVTWRYKVKNINSILKKHRDKKNIFIKNLDKSCNTAFFKVEKSIFKNYFVWAGEKVNDKNNIYLEHIYYNIIKEGVEVESFSELPKFSWMSWGWRRLDNKFKDIIKAVLNCLWFFKF